jgi:hypothetical protein
MTRPNIQIDDLVREMTEEEYESHLQDVQRQQARQAEDEARIATRQAALAKLSSIGLTEEEIAAL